MPLNQIKCPNCGTLIEVDQELQKQMESSLRSEFDAIYQKERAELEAEKKKMENFKAKEKELFESQLKKRMDEEKRVLLEQSKAEQSQYEKNLKSKIEEENKEQYELMQKELQEKSDQLKELNKTKADVERLRREKEELRETIRLESERELNEKLKVEREKILSAEQEKNELRLKEKDKQLEDQKKLTEEMKRKLEQGSTQLQGEVQELAIEEFLREAYPLDSIEEIKKGARGADCIQTINTREYTNCGKIYYESKRTENFAASWIPKFKDDMRLKNIEVGVLVTKNMPKEYDRAEMVDGIWICSFDEFKSLSKVLREAMIRIHQVSLSQVNKGDKMQLLYDYLTSPTFKMQLSTIVETFEKMKSDLDREKRAMQKLWKERETQIERVVNSTIDMYGSLKGIAGNSISSINSLELDSGESEDTDA